MQKKFLKRNLLKIASAAAMGAALAVGMSVWATSVGTNVTVSGTLTVDGASTLTGAVTASDDLTVTSGARVGTGSTGDHLTALATDSLLVEGQAEYDGIVWFDGSLRASSTLLVTGVATFYTDVTLANATSTNFAITTFATTSALRVSNDATIQGNITLGTDSADTLTVNAYATLTQATSTNFAITTFATTSALRVSNDATIQGNTTLGTDSVDTLTVNAYATLTQATSTHLAVTSFASTSQLTVSNAFFQTTFGDCVASTNKVVYTLSTGKFGCGTDAPGDGRDWGVTVAQDSIRPTTTVGIIVNYASSTMIGLNLTRSTTTLATTTTLNVDQFASTSALRVSNASTLQGDVTVGQSSSQTLTVNAYTTLTQATSTNFAATTFATTSALRVSNDATIQGNITLGTDSVDTLTVNAYATLTQATSTNFAATSFATTSALSVSNNATIGGTLGVTGVTTHTGTTKMGANGTALTQVLTGFVDCGPILDAQSIAATSTGTVGCTTGLSNVATNDAVFLTATTTAMGTGSFGSGRGTVIYTGKASTTAANRIQAELYNMTDAAWTVTTSTWRYLIIR
ncbi:MAG: hypothetical protein HYT98_01455 [Candidatus Sungbacteria bacterium]|nr:hypothetical protein [Candidatus Sungbacteria bacterium]